MNSSSARMMLLRNSRGVSAWRSASALRPISSLSSTACSNIVGPPQNSTIWNSRFVVASQFSTVSSDSTSNFGNRPHTCSHPFSTNAVTAANIEPEPERQYQYFQNVVITESGVAIVKFDGPKSVNTISFEMKDEARRLWQDLSSNSAIKAVVYSSGKPNTFIAGADIGDIAAIEDKSTVIPIIRDATDLFQEMASSSLPLVAAIDGPALGGGLEWTLWCDYRICTDSPSTKLGLPEVKLGLLPGFGGTVNLPRIVGLQNALDMMLTGKEVRPKQAKKWGLVDEVVSLPSLESRAIAVAESLADGSLKATNHAKQKSWMNYVIEDTTLGQSQVWKTVEAKVQKSTSGKYPAPLQIIQVLKAGLATSDTEEKLTMEREGFAALAATPESEALIGIFEGMTSCKPKQNTTMTTTQPDKRIAVLGAGLMGAGIAQVSAEKGGFEVLLKDRDLAGLSKGEAYLDDNWGAKLKKRRMTQYQYNIHKSNIIPLTDTTKSWPKHFAKTDLVIEAVFEDLSLKRKILSQMESVTPAHTIFATNTSAIPIRDIAAGCARPGNVLGMHYFSPVPNMPLLEIIPHDGTSTEVLERSLRIGTKQGKTCIVVKDVPGFYVNRCLGPYLVEVSALVKDGVPLEKLDASMKEFGMPVGPITLADEVGLDVGSHVATFLSKADLGERMHGGDLTLMQNMMAKGWLGRKASQGFYTYSKNSKGKEVKTINADVRAYVEEFADRKLDLSTEEIQNRIVGRFVNEAAKCLEDGIIDNPAVGDIGMVLGTGFAPFRGGPFRYLDQMGSDKFCGMMMDMAERYDGKQFVPCDLLQEYAKTGKKFHGR